MKKETEKIAENLGFGVVFYSKTRFHLYFYDDLKSGHLKKNSKGETLSVGVTLCSNHGKGKHDLPYIWYKNGYTSEFIPEWWGIMTYVTNEDGRTYGEYNPTSKPSETGKTFVINFDWHLPANTENLEKILCEILRRFNA